MMLLLLLLLLLFLLLFERCCAYCFACRNHTRNNRPNGSFARREMVSVQNMVMFHCAQVRRELLKQKARPDAPADAAAAVMQGFAQHVRNEKEVRA